MTVPPTTDDIDIIVMPHPKDVGGTCRYIISVESNGELFPLLRKYSNGMTFYMQYHNEYWAKRGLALAQQKFPNAFIYDKNAD